MFTISRRGVLASTLAATAASIGGPARASGFPNKPIKLVVPYSPGGGSDFVARLFAQKLTETMGWSVIVDNKAGASGMIGTDSAAKSPADGYTLLLVDTAHATNAAVQPRLPFDPISDFAPITLVGSSPQLLVAHPGLQANSLKELLAMPASQASTLAVGTPGQGSAPHLLFEQLKFKTGLGAVHVPYKGGALALSDAVGGQIPMVINSIPACMPHIQAKRLKVLAIATAARDPRLPGVPTFAETVPGFEGAAWYGFVAPAKVPTEVLQQLDAAIGKVMDMPDVKSRLGEAFIDTMPRGPAVFARFMNDDIARWQSIVKQTGFTLN